MPAPLPLPVDLARRPFTVAEALGRGLGRDVLRGARLRAPYRGVRVPAALPDTLDLRCRAASLVLPPDAVFSRRTAARLRSIPVPGDWRHEPLDVTTAVPGLRHRGIALHRPLPGGAAPACVAGLPVSPAEHTWAALATLLDVDDLVIAGDALLRHGWADAAALRAVVGASVGRRGVRRLTASLPLLDPRSDSPMETRLRLLLMRSGLPRPCANRDVVEKGEWIARPDLSYPEYRIAIEYEGDHHRTDRRQWRHDKSRRRLLEDRGWWVIEVIADDVFRTPADTVARVRAALATRSAP